jgi:hypothetical protein
MRCFAAGELASSQVERLFLDAAPVRGGGGIVSRKLQGILVFLSVAALASLVLSGCLEPEDVGEGIAKGQGTAQIEMAKQGTAIAQEVATVVDSYERERERQGEAACTSAMLPLLCIGLWVTALQKRRN